MHPYRNFFSAAKKANWKMKLTIFQVLALFSSISDCCSSFFYRAIYQHLPLARFLWYSKLETTFQLRFLSKYENFHLFSLVSALLSLIPVRIYSITSLTFWTPSFSHVWWVEWMKRVSRNRMNENSGTRFEYHASGLKRVPSTSDSQLYSLRVSYMKDSPRGENISLSYLLFCCV